MTDGQASLIWGFPIVPILSSYGEKKIKYGLNMVFHWKSIKNNEKKNKKIDKSRHVALYSQINIRISN